ncbi:uncharacterized protein LOC127871688 [Dreissena polymorpha]|uniref:uncharacterized protein LOC127867168 n=3 Tax=Dreissena polymorpha TaxID=45954 RepID=UPI002263EC1C|nr:uncharacterized protein LOC127867168 [Dreissena polymorpha]XP_052270777.1 uncharacterized protein LOC127871688 [Dreissena polymorpha]
MVNYCRVIGCHNNSTREKDRHFYRLPEIITNQCKKTSELSTERRRLWLARLQQDFSGKNLKNIRVCSDHFVSKQKAELFDRDSPDWAPSVNMGCQAPSTPAPKVAAERFERRKKRAETARSLVQDLSDNNTPELPPDVNLDSAKNVQTDMLTSDVESLEQENKRLKLENENLKTSIRNASMFSQETLKDNDERVRYFTGLSCFAILMSLYKYLYPYLTSKHSVTLGKFECLVMTLSRLRLNLTVNHLAYQLNVSCATISRTFVNTIDIMYVRLKPIVRWPDRASLRATMPVQFQRQFGNKCAVIIDCFEIFIERPSNLIARAETWSSYKHHNTVKFLIGITPQGVVSFISKGWGGRASDKYVTEHCNFLDNILPGDLVLADRGFDIADSVGSVCGSLKIPAFTKGKDQLSPLDVETTRKIANVRIHVERVIGLVRQKYTFLNGTLPLDLVITKDEDGFTTIDKIAHVCCALVNLCESVVDFDK